MSSLNIFCFGGRIAWCLRLAFENISKINLTIYSDKFSLFFVSSLNIFCFGGRIARCLRLAFERQLLINITGSSQDWYWKIIMNRRSYIMAQWLWELWIVKSKFKEKVIYWGKDAAHNLQCRRRPVPYFKRHSLNMY